ncbi:MAG: DUF2334 domain-containing protein [Pirellulales bacterium]
MLLVSLHDVAPYHLERIRRAERLFAEWGVKKITYLLIPDYLGQQRADRSDEFAAFICQTRPFEADWFLHGYYHLAWNDAANKPVSDVPPQATNKQLGQADNDEFQHLDAAASRPRLQRGKQVFAACLGHPPTGFIAPRWRMDPRVVPVLAEQGFTWTEGMRHVLHVPSNRRLDSPVITWATRTAARKLTSIIGTPLLSLATRRSPLLRVAMHPFDFDHPATIRSIEHVLKGEIQRRRQALYGELTSTADSLLAARRAS